MKIFIKNKLVSFGGSSVATNESGETVFKIKGKWTLFSPTRKKKIFDKDGKLLFIVRNKWLNFWSHRAYIFDANKQKIATVKDIVRVSNGAKYVVEGYKDEISFDGKFFGGTLNILSNGTKIGTLVQDFNIVRDSFSLEAGENDIAFLTALVIAIDNINDKRTKN